MTKWRGRQPGAVAGMILVILLTAGVAKAGHPPSEVQVDMGYIMPRGDLGDSFTGTPLGFGADPGYEVGFLWRYRFDERWSLAGAFHFVKFSDFEGTDETAGDYAVLATSYRYELQLRRSFRPGALWQPFITAGAGVFRNRFDGRDKILLESFDRSVSTLGYTLQLGLRRDQVEFSAVYMRNRFSSPRFFGPDPDQDYDWDTVSIRFSWLIPGS